MSATRRGRARRSRADGRAHRETVAANLDRIRRVPEGRQTLAGIEHLIMPGDEYTVRDGEGRLVISERSPDYLLLPAVHARALMVSPQPLGKAVSRRVTKRKS